ncbi:MAG: hypothetical protein U1E17_06175 [Geminicoccaceae bacterium]
MANRVSAWAQVPKAGTGGRRLGRRCREQRGQLVEQNAPGHDVDHEVVQGQEHALAPVGMAFDDAGGEQRPIGQVGSGLPGRQLPRNAAPSPAGMRQLS